MIRGLDGFMKRLEHAAGDIDAALSRELERVARDGMDMARELAPVGDGRSGRHLVDSFSCEARGLRACVQVTNGHAAYVEFGTGRRGAMSAGVSPANHGYDGDWPGMAAQPYMYPMAQRMRGEFPERMTRAAREALRTGRNGK